MASFLVDLDSTRTLSMRINRTAWTGVNPIHFDSARQLNVCNFNFNFQRNTFITKIIYRRFDRIDPQLLWWGSLGAVSSSVGLSRRIHHHRALCSMSAGAVVSALWRSISWLRRTLRRGAVYLNTEWHAESSLWHGCRMEQYKSFGPVVAARTRRAPVVVADESESPAGSDSSPRGNSTSMTHRSISRRRRLWNWCGRAHAVTAAALHLGAESRQSTGSQSNATSL